MQHSAGILLYRKSPQFEVLIVHPSGTAKKDHTWSLPKGHIEPNESAIDAAIRETAEEIGYNVKPEDLEDLHEITYRSGRKIVHGFAAQFDNIQTPKVNSWEIDEVKWCLPEEAEKLLHIDQAKFVASLKFLLFGWEPA